MKKMPAKASPGTGHPIQVVTRRTGLSADVIRVWERRYSAVQPARLLSGRRHYSDADIERLNLLRRATELGRRIGEVAQIPMSTLARLVADDESAVAYMAERPAAAAPIAGVAGQYLVACLTAVHNMDASALDKTLSDAAVALSLPVLLEHVIGPLMNEVGERWHSGELRVSHEHLATAGVRSFLGGIAATSNMTGRGPSVVITTPAGQDHELGALMVAVTAASNGWNAVYLAPNTPSSEIAATVVRNGAKVVAMSIAYPADDPRIPDELRRLHRQLPEDVTLLVGGRAAASYEKVLTEIGATQLSTLDKFRQALEKFRQRGVG
jgi:MerR family transcriptional regulator, light-induced transcriptional regulator